MRLTITEIISLLIPPDEGKLDLLKSFAFDTCPFLQSFLRFREGLTLEQ